MTALLVAAAALAGAGEPAPLAPLPSPRQLAWHDVELAAFVHFGINTFTDREWGDGKEDPALFQPSALDCRQWARVCREAGARGIILTAKHHDGFCLWPSKLTKHTVAASPWRGGKGDVVRELSEACREAGLAMGVYLSPWDRNAPVYGSGARYNDFYVAQLEELLGGHGPLFEVWFDGACGEGPDGRKQTYDWPRFIEVVRRLQPGAVIFSDAGPDVRWVGNEKGFAGPTNWCPLRRDRFFPGTPDHAELTAGHEDGTHWVPAECDVSIRPGWFHHPKEDGAVKTLEQLVEIWHASVGRGAGLLLNLPVDRRGLVPEADAARLRELRAALDEAYRVDLLAGGRASATSVRGGDARFAAARVLGGGDGPPGYWATDDGVTAAAVAVELARPVTVDRVLAGERIELGQRVRAFAVEARVEGAWRTVAEGTTIGRKRIVRFPGVRADAVRLAVRDARACLAIARLSAYGPGR